MNSRFPRLLIINTSPIADTTGSGITLGNLFFNWPTEKMFQLCYSDEGVLEQARFPYVLLPPKTAYIDNIIRGRIIRPQLSTYFNKDTSGMNAGITRSSPKAILHDFIRALLDTSPIRIPDSINEQVDAFQPQVIYSILGNLRMLKTVRYFARRHTIKVVAHFMDDWPSTIYTSSSLTGWAHHKVNREIRGCLTQSKCSLGISELMAEVYKERYGAEFTWACNPIEIQDTPSQPQTEPDVEEIIFTYSGGLHLNRWKSLETIAQELEEIVKQGHRVVLQIYTSEAHRQTFQPQMKELSVIRWMGSVAADQVPEVLNKSTVLIHVESFDPNIVNYTRFSFSTKLSQYMASGRPILAYAPADLASTLYLQKYGTGLVADTPAVLSEHLQQLLADTNLRHKIGQRGREYAQLHHETSMVQTRVLDVIRSNSARE